MRSVRITRSGELWVGTDRGVASLQDQRFVARATGDVLAGPSIRRIVEDRDGSLWFCCDQWPDRGAASGLTHWRSGSHRSYRVDDGLPSNYVRCVCVTRSGQVCLWSLGD